ncbi:alpha-L-fucosidase-domain-containing protein [Radiomyces spectabilis]|uniref:alpha-L-fucosidase-domain-containing protein n=1 Tax=Radiomyces spectabilis TaxID=64574 RepID=UPI00221F8D13|nr:alpha-L-fucosidase-domain-containing protein [Radiomyces spectabilis]KAI8381456.1 alpha-L-fucosidase-domain-containing protein [Radiomyces spectabilis]
MKRWLILWLPLQLLLKVEGLPTKSVLVDAQRSSSFYHLNLDAYYNNKGFGTGADLDGRGSYITATEHLNNTASSNLVQYKTAFGNAADNVKANGQTIQFPTKEILGALYMLVTATVGPMATHVTVTYADGSTDSTALDVPDWRAPDVGFLDRITVVSAKDNRNDAIALFSIPVLVDPRRGPAISMSLPPSVSSSSDTTLHVFGITAYQATQSGLLVTFAKATSCFLETNTMQGPPHPLVNIELHNTGKLWANHIRVRIFGNGITSTEETVLTSLAPGHRQLVDVAIDCPHCPDILTPVPVTVEVESVNDHRQVVKTSVSLVLNLATQSFNKMERSLQRHCSPRWLQRAKFGIFIHWGVYSVPAWAPTGKEYAEWYWWQMNHVNDPTHQYHREHYGENFAYDDFIQQWNTTLFNPRHWLDLISASNARYYVFTTKHHDGIALFNTSLTDRSTVALGPRRDFVNELLSVSKSDYPGLRRGLYFSLPEWYHPKYQDDSLGWHGPPYNPYTNKPIPYTGYAAVQDFVNELQVPQIRELIHQYEPDIMWCDIGGINNSTEWQAEYYNQARAHGREVGVNDRCGNSVSDFQTVEYKKLDYVPARLWEATRGIDPYSFGFNRATTDEQYASVTSLIQELVDTVAKGGNFLLNIGPEASGDIPRPMQSRLQAIGLWLNTVEKSIFDAEPYWVQKEESSSSLRFTIARDGLSMYIFAFDAPSASQLVVTTPIAVLDTQENTVIQLMNSQQPVTWHIDEKASLVIDVTNINFDPNHHVWVFQITRHL